MRYITRTNKRSKATSTSRSPPELGSLRMKIEFTKSKPDEAEILSDLAIESKGYWGYSREQLEVWRNDLRITPEYIAENTVRTICSETETERAGFFAIQQKEDAILDHLW